MNDTPVARDVANMPAHGVTMREAFWTWMRVAALSFGGPAGQIAVMHRILVEEKKWISESRFLHALNYCMLLPGPEAQQLATYIGWLMHRTAGGIARRRGPVPLQARRNSGDSRVRERRPRVHADPRRVILAARLTAL